MRRTSRLVLLAGVFLAALVFVVVIFLGGGGDGGGGVGAQPTPTAPVNLPTVVASVDIPLGTVITAEMLTTRTLDVANREAGALGDTSQAVGEIAGTNIAAGGQVTTNDFLTRDIELTVPPGLRALPIAVNELSGVARLVETGDTVDVIVTINEAAFTEPQGIINPLTTKMVLQDIQVIGTVEPALAAPTNEQGQPIGTPTPGYVGDFPTGSKLIIVAVTAQQAEVLVYVRTLNERNSLGDQGAPATQVDLVLRSPEDAGIVETTTGIILRNLIDLYGVLPPEVVPIALPSPSPEA